MIKQMKEKEIRGLSDESLLKWRSTLVTMKDGHDIDDNDNGIMSFHSGKDADRVMHDRRPRLEDIEAEIERRGLK